MHQEILIVVAESLSFLLSVKFSSQKSATKYSPYLDPGMEEKIQ